MIPTGSIPMQCLECHRTYQWRRNELIAAGVPACPSCGNRLLEEAAHGEAPKSKTHAAIIAQEPHTVGGAAGGHGR